MRILVVGGGFVNKGAEAMVKTVQAELGRRIPGATFYFHGRPMEDRAFLESESIQLLPQPGRIAKARRLAALSGTHPSLVGHVLLHRHMSQAVAVSQVDAVVDVSGYAYGDPWGAVYAKQMAAMATFAKTLRKPYVLLPQAWGPFDNAELALAVRRICAQASMAYVRDDQSMSDLAALFGQQMPPTVRPSPDIAFLFREKREPSLPAHVDGRKIEQGTPIAAVAPNMRIYERTEGTGAHNHYLRFLMAVCTTLVSHGFRVLLIPHEVDRKDTGGTDDRLLCSIVESALRDERVYALVDRMSAGEIKERIGAVQCLVGSRFHALVGALSQGIPCFAISWSHKYKELLKSFGLDRYVLGHEAIEGQLQDSALLIEFLDRLPTLKSQVESALPKIKKSVEKTFDVTASVLAHRDAPD